METMAERVTLSYDMFGSEDIDMTGQKPAIIFLHGVTSSKETWKNLIRPIAVATGRKAYAYDARNHGESGWSDQHNYDNLHKDLLDFMKSQLIKQAVLVGHSMGGKTAMVFATKWPQRVEKLIIEDISAAPLPQQVVNLSKAYLNVLEQALKQISPDITDLEEAKKAIQKIMQDKIPQENLSSRYGSEDGSALSLCKDKDGKFTWKTNLKAILESFLDESNLTEITGMYTGPTLVLYGTKSPLKVSADKDYIRSVFPSAQFRAIEGATHNVHSEYEDIFINDVVDFINDS